MCESVFNLQIVVNMPISIYVTKNTICEYHLYKRKAVKYNKMSFVTVPKSENK